MHKVILIAYANSGPHTLPTLNSEFKEINGALLEGQIAGAYIVIPIPEAKAQNVIDVIEKYQDQLVMFHFSGHADEKTLFLNDISANADGLASLLKRCKSLKLVVLNGCATHGQVDSLLTAGVDNVIATSAKVNDNVAAKFSKAFYSYFSKGYMISESLEYALDNLKTIGKMPAVVFRGDELDEPEEEYASEQGLWYLSNFSKNDKDWRLPGTRVIPKEVMEFVPNLLLIREVHEAFYYRGGGVESYKIEFDKWLNSNNSQNEDDYKKYSFIDVTPQPINNHLLALFSRMENDNTGNFSQFLDVDRLIKLNKVFRAVIELLAFILLSQLWSEIAKNKRVKIPLSLRDAILNFVTLETDEQRNCFEFLPIIKGVREVFEANNIPFFITGYEDVYSSFNNNEEFMKAYQNQQKLSRELANGRIIKGDNDVPHRCISAEEDLAMILGNLRYFVDYIMVSVKAINYVKFRHRPEPKFEHTLISLIHPKYRSMGPSVQDRKSPSDSICVYIVRKEDGDTAHLNLSPFVVDKNANIVKSPSPDLYAFFRGGGGQNKYYSFRDLNSRRNLFSTREKNELNFLDEQFDAFVESIKAAAE